ncbi:hypothetical protein BDB01DRAFT_606772 [Pilobolus umbonatus]|nr:hypothetical protein BDB01DRAFT_606772 [Pilobolus umbonatus]
MGFCRRCGEIAAGRCGKCGGRSVESTISCLVTEGGVSIVDRWQSQYADTILAEESLKVSANTKLIPTAQSDFYTHSCTQCRKILGKDMLLEEDLPYCKECHSGLFSKGVCNVCYIQVLERERFIEYSNSVWHADCFHCYNCHVSLEDNPLVDLVNRPCCEPCFMSNSRSKSTHLIEKPLKIDTAQLMSKPLTESSYNSDSYSSQSSTSTADSISSLYKTHYSTRRPRIHTDLFQPLTQPAPTKSSTFEGRDPKQSIPRIKEDPPVITESPLSIYPHSNKDIRDTTTTRTLSVDNPISRRKLSSSSIEIPTLLPTSSTHRKLSNASIEHAISTRRPSTSSTDSSFFPTKSTAIPTKSSIPTRNLSCPVNDYPPRKLSDASAENPYMRLFSPSSDSTISSISHNTCHYCQETLGEGIKVKMALSPTKHVWFHVSCFVCTKCHVPMKNGECTTDGHAFYHPQCMINRCYECQGSISNDAIQYENKSYHFKCFLCHECNHAIPWGQPFFEENQYRKCQSCYNPLFKRNPEVVQPIITPQKPRQRTLPKFGGSKNCFSCGDTVSIMDDTPGPYASRWHKKCLRCEKCKKQMDSNANVYKNEQGKHVVYCRGCHDK